MFEAAASMVEAAASMFEAAASVLNIFRAPSHLQVKRRVGRERARRALLERQQAVLKLLLRCGGAARWQAGD